MKALVLAAAVGAAFLSIPALACGMMGNAAANATAPQAAGGSMAPVMCAMPAPATQAQVETGQGTQPGQAPAMSGGCPCCRAMAMMQPRPGQQGAMPGMGGMDHHGMPEMRHGAPEAPKPASPAPEVPKPGN